MNSVRSYTLSWTFRTKLRIRNNRQVVVEILVHMKFGGSAKDIEECEAGN